MTEVIKPEIDIVMGMVVNFKDIDIHITKELDGDIDTEYERLYEALKEALYQVNDIYNYTVETMGLDEAREFLEHKKILEDDSIRSLIIKEIQTEQSTAQWALNKIIDNHHDDEVIKVLKILLKILMPVKPLDIMYDDKILVVESITDKVRNYIINNDILGIVITDNEVKLEELEDMNMPLVISKIKNGDFKTGDVIILDEKNNEVTLRPSDSELIKLTDDCTVEEIDNDFKEKIEEHTVTKDGYPIDIMARILTRDDIYDVIEHKFDGVGIFKTESLFEDRTPSEEEQYNVYKELTQILMNKPLVIRTLDKVDISDESGLLGSKGIRYSLNNISLFTTQIRAILRASAFGNIKVVFPMISGYEELIKIKSIISNIKDDLDEKGIDYNDNIEIGIMIGLPSTALITDIIAKEVNFINIDIDELVQYTIGVDKENRNLSELFSPYHPSVIRIIMNIIDEAHNAGIKVGITGNLSEYERLIPIIIGMGIDEICIWPPTVKRVRELIGNIVKNNIQGIIDKIIKMPSSKAIETFLKLNLR